MTEYVYIQSSKSIMVTAGLQNQNVTNPDAHVPDRLKINPLWPRLRVLIKQGKGVYPAFIRNWPTVKALEKEGVFTIVDCKDIDVNEEAKTTKATLERQMSFVKNKMPQAKEVKDITLDSIGE